MNESNSIRLAKLELSIAQGQLLAWERAHWSLHMTQEETEEHNALSERVKTAVKIVTTTMSSM